MNNHQKQQLHDNVEIWKQRKSEVFQRFTTTKSILKYYECVIYSHILLVMQIHIFSTVRIHFLWRLPHEEYSKPPAAASLQPFNTSQHQTAAPLPLSASLCLMQSHQ